MWPIASLEQCIGHLQQLKTDGELVTAPDMKIRVGTGGHSRRHSEVRCYARGRRAKQWHEISLLR
jgi:hypothetical protein